MFSAGLLSRYKIGKLAATTDVSAVAIPLAGIKTTNFDDPATGRNYDYAPGGGLRAEVRLYGGAREIVAAGYGVVWARTINGASKDNRLQFFHGSLRVPIAGPLGIGGSYSWYSRQTTYARFVPVLKSQNEWRAFVNLAFGASRRPPEDRR